MADPWLTIIGLGEDGPAGLSPASRDALDRAEVIIGGPRHLALVGADARGVEWPVPFSTAPVLAARGRQVVALASGDPFWHGAGGSLMADLATEEWTSHPTPSCFQLAANRMGWRPFSEVARMDKRRWPRLMRSSMKTPCSSGPR